MAVLTSEEGCQWPALLTKRAGSDADSARVADTVVGLWHEIDEALHPIIGRRGVAALYFRSLTLTAGTHAWLAHGHPGTQQPETAKGTMFVALEDETGSVQVIVYPQFHCRSHRGPDTVARQPVDCEQGLLLGGDGAGEEAVSVVTHANKRSQLDLD